MTNEQMVKLVHQGNKKYMSLLWDKNRWFIFHLFSKLLRCNPVNAQCMIAAGLTIEDLKQEAYFILLNAVDSFDASGGYSFLSSLYYATKSQFFNLIGMNTAKGRNDPFNKADRLERKIDFDGNSVTVGEMISDERAIYALETVENKEYLGQLTEVVQGALSRLKSSQRLVLEKAFFQEKNYRQISKEIGIPYHTVKQRRDSGLRALGRGKNYILLLPFYFSEDVPSVAYHGSLLSFKEHQASSTERILLYKERQQQIY